MQSDKFKIKPTSPQKPKERNEPSEASKENDEGWRKAVYYLAESAKYFIRNSRGDFIKVNEVGVRRILRYPQTVGIEARPLENWEIDKAILEIQVQNDVAYAGPLAGYSRGIQHSCGSRILVTKNAKHPESKKGEFPAFAKLLDEMFGERKKYILGWLKAAIRSLEAGPPFRAGQMLAICGRSGCGKSLLQDIITEILGGRCTKPYRYLSGKTDFNADLFAAEHLTIEDDASSTDLRSRRAFGAGLKNLCVNSVQSCHDKGDRAVSLTPFWRLSITCNLEPEYLMVLPPLDESLTDKIILLKSEKAKLPFGPDNLDERRAFRQRISTEIAAFLFWLRRWRIPASIEDQRYGVAAYQDESLVQELRSLAPEARLLDLIDAYDIWAVGTSAWEGTAAELERVLRTSDRTGEVARLLAFNTAAGVYLARLASSMPHRIQTRGQSGGVKRWVLKKATENQN